MNRQKTVHKSRDNKNIVEVEGVSGGKDGSAMTTTGME